MAEVPSSSSRGRGSDCERVQTRYQMGAQQGLVHLLNWPCLSSLCRLSRLDELSSTVTGALTDFVRAFLLHPWLIFNASLASIADLNLFLAKETALVVLVMRVMKSLFVLSRTLPSAEKLW